MPYNGAGKGSFRSDENIPNTFDYEIVNWVRVLEHPRRRSGKRIKENELPYVDFMVVKVTKRDDKVESYDTLYGPIEDWDTLEGFLAYDYGEEGSLSVASGS